MRRGIHSGFRIGFDRNHKLRSAAKNHASTDRLATQVQSYINSEVSTGKLRLVASSTHIHVSPLGLIPKKNRPDKFRLIVDLSAPPGRSVNDGISPTLCSLQYTSVGTATRWVRPGMFMAKLDLKSAYRMVPVHPSDQWLLGVSWEGHVYCDQALSFGLRSTPLIFTAVADALAWAMLCRGLPILLHYIDDFLFWAPSDTLCCQYLLQAASLCRELGLPAEPLKVEGPATSITFLGIEIDSIKQELRLPQAKLASLKRILATWSKKRAASKREFQVLLGHLNHAVTVVPAGKAFLRHLIDVSYGSPEGHSGSVYEPHTAVRITHV